jgi:hypothetical protein
VGHVGFTDGTTHVGLEIGASKIEFYSNGLVFDERADTTEEVKTFVEGGPNFGTVGFARDDSDGTAGIRGGSCFSSGQAQLTEFQSEWSAGSQGDGAMKEIAPGKSVCFHICSSSGQSG